MHRVMNDAMNHQTNEFVTRTEINNRTLAEQLTHAVGEVTNQKNMAVLFNIYKHKAVETLKVNYN